MKKYLLYALVLCFCATDVVMSKSYTVKSPNGNILVTVSDDDGLHLSLQYRDEALVQPSPIGINTANKISKVKATNLDEQIVAPFYRQREFRMIGRQLNMKLNDGYGLQVRAYDEGVAYRFYTMAKGETIVNDETAEYSFAGTPRAWLCYSTNDKNPFAMAFQNTYDETLLSEAKDKYIFLPATIQITIPLIIAAIIVLTRMRLTAISDAEQERAETETKRRERTEYFYGYVSGKCQRLWICGAA